MLTQNVTEDIFNISFKDSHPDYVENSQNSDYTTEIWARNLSRHLIKDNIHMTNKREWNAISHQGNASQNPNEMQEHTYQGG